ncbi:MAG: efflux RND transporter periplasmic adaptor subunit, partial [Anderseniella sp.]
GWFGSGYIYPSSATNDGVKSETVKQQAESEARAKPFLVGVREYKAQPRRNVFPVRGTTEASSKVEVRARTPGIVQVQGFAAGDTVKKGDLLCKLDEGAREAQMARAKAQLASAARDYDATRQLAKGNFAAKAKVSSDKARLELAQAELAQLELDMSWTQITAPVDGVIAAEPAKAGDFLQVGGMCATLHVMNPLNVEAQVPERLLPNVSEGMNAAAKLITGETVTGKITSIAMSSNRETRTFKVKLEVANPDVKLREGVTSELYVELPEIQAHKLPVVALTLSDTGKIGVRTVDDVNTVKFLPVNILTQENDGTWVTGLPESVMVIVQGQDFVIDGQVVETSAPVEGAS